MATRHPWAGLCAALAAGSLCAWIAGNPQAWLWHSVRWQQPWTVFTAAFVHLSTAHLLANLLALAALALLGEALRVGAAATWAWLAAWPLGTAALGLWPEMSTYGGLSLVVHAGVAVLAVQCALRPGPVQAGSVGGIRSDARLPGRGWALTLGAGLAAKLIAERSWQHALLFDAGWGFKVALAAHLSGALAGLVCGLLAVGAAAWRLRKPAP